MSMDNCVFVLLCSIYDSFIQNSSRATSNSANISLTENWLATMLIREQVFILPLFKCRDLMLCLRATCVCVFLFSQGPFAASLDRSARRLSNHHSDVRGDCTDKRPLIGKLPDQSTTDSAGVQHHPGGFACQRCWDLNWTHFTPVVPDREDRWGPRKKNNWTFYMQELTWTKGLFLAYIKATVTFAIY